MEASFDEQVHEAIVRCIGEAALKVLVQGGELTADTVTDAIRALAGDEPDIGRGFALLLLLKK
ncbi:hypothetical protein [Pantoea sp. 3_1284]|uniref:hypothetical protein n=1 Tax=Pantoea sp. 3_1284 TaxID=2259618 RepID=UPI000DE2F32C|nr:hypothetical protein [Pantoea sp. 3_1284]RBO14361.1 hypothetical protein DSL62_05035 [Pantoea sp. 3_1284]